MSSSKVDNRIVQMQFDNKQFESGVNTSISTLDKLKKSLNLDAAAASLNNLGLAGKNFSLAGISTGVENASGKFSALGVMGIGALAGIGAAAAAAGAALLHSLTVEPVMDGLSEYETKMNAIQTILTNTSSKGTTLDQVNHALGELNEYSDKTIYNFAQMTDNIGKMTAAGLGLEDSVAVVKGLSNVAAGFGVDAQRMAGATYQMSQALSAGVVKLQDWNSMQQAGMGGDMIQKELIATARSMGKVVDAGVPFRETLEKGWLTSDVFVKTMKKMSDNQMLTDAAQNVTSLTKLIGTMKESVGSGWAQTWENIIGNKDQSTKLFTDLNNGFSSIIKPSTEARNAMWAFWNQNGGRDAFIKGLGNIFTAISRIVKPIHDAFKEIFPPEMGMNLVAISKGFEKFTSYLVMSEKMSNNLKNTFRGLYTVISIPIDIFKISFGILFTIISKVTGLLGKGSGGLLEGVLTVTGAFGGFVADLRQAIIAGNLFSFSLEKLTKASEFLKTAFGGTFKVVSDMIDKFINFINTTTIVSDTINEIKYASSQLSSGFQAFTKLLQQVGAGIGGLALKAFGASIVLLGYALTGLNDVLDKAKQKIEPIKMVLQQVGTAIYNYLAPAIEYLAKKFDQLKMSDVIGLLSSGGLLLAGGGILKMAKALKGLTDSVGDITEGFVKVLDGVTGSLEAFQTKLKADAIFRVATAVLLLAASIVILSMIDPAKLAKALFALSIVFSQLATTMTILNKASFGTIKMGPNLVALGVAVLLMSFAMKKLSEIDVGGLTQAVESMATILTMLAIFIKVTSNSAGIQTGMWGLIGIALAVDILASAVTKLAKLNPEQATQGVKALTTIMGTLTLFIKMVGNPERIIAIGFAVILIATAMNIFAGALALLGLIPIPNLVKGLTAMAAALMAITLATRLMPKDGQFIAIGIGINLMAMSLYLIAGAVAIFGNMPIEVLAQGIKALAAALLVMALTARVMKGTLSGAAALLVMALAINVLVPAIAILGNLPLKTIGVALLALAGVFVVLGLAGLILAPLAPIILTLSYSVGVLGLGVLAMGAGLVLFAAGLASVAAGGSAFAAALILIITAFAQTIPIILKELALGLIEFAKVIRDGAPVIGEAFFAVLTTLIKMIVVATPMIVATLFYFIDCMVAALVGSAYKLTVAAMQVMIAILDGIASKMDELTQSAINVAIQFINGVISKLPDIIDAAFRLVIAFINGLADAIDNNHNAIFDACGRLITSIINAMADFLPKLITVGENVISGIISGIENMGGALWQAIKDAGAGMLSRLCDALGIHSPSREFAKIGKFSMMGLAGGIDRFGKLASNSAVNAGVSAVSSLQNAMSNLSSIVDSNIDTNPTIRPVLDLSNVQNGSRQLYSMMDKYNGYALDSTLKLADNASKTMQYNQSQKYESVKPTTEPLKQDVTNINFNGSYSFNDKKDIDYFMTESAKLINRRR